MNTELTNETTFAVTIPEHLAEDYADRMCEKMPGDPAHDVARKINDAPLIVLRNHRYLGVVLTQPEMEELVDDAQYQGYETDDSELRTAYQRFSRRLRKVKVS